ncbi:MAG: 50S ribosomal protein L10 [bacterium]|nr:50S ribosomal protein L10 [bacterium]
MRPAIIQKQKAVNELKEKLAHSSGFVLTDHRGLTVKEITELRRRLRETNSEYHIVKNTLLQRALEGTNLASLRESLNGPTSVAFTSDPNMTVAKILLGFAKEFDKPAIKAGAFENKALTAKEVDAIANLPSKEVLIGRVLGGIQAPLTRLVNCLAAPMRGLLTVLKAASEKAG